MNNIYLVFRVNEKDAKALQGEPIAAFASEQEALAWMDKHMIKQAEKHPYELLEVPFNPEPSDAPIRRADIVVEYKTTWRYSQRETK